MPRLLVKAEEGARVIVEQSNVRAFTVKPNAAAEGIMMQRFKHFQIIDDVAEVFKLSGVQCNFKEIARVTVVSEAHAGAHQHALLRVESDEHD